jgi:alkanesulfonate monooxygenase SsuD/methylene tetrahydromethanopterin reductase-like flavin-dependent oxidoreductase (luciferase family)
LLEDALELLPLLWGPGSPTYEGRAIGTVEAICYPRPLQEHVPILVGGSGERVTLKLVAKHADACNLFGEADTVRRKVDVLRRHCDDVGRDPAEIVVTQLSTVRVIDEGSDRPGPDAATVAEHVGRFRDLADAGLHTAIVNMADLGDTAPLERFAPVVDAFR